MPVWVEGAAEVEFSFISYEHECSIFYFRKAGLAQEWGWLVHPTNQPHKLSIACLMEVKRKVERCVRH